MRGNQELVALGVLITLLIAVLGGRWLYGTVHGPEAGDVRALMSGLTMGLLILCAKRIVLLGTNRPAGTRESLAGRLSQRLTGSAAPAGDRRMAGGAGGRGRQARLERLPQDLADDPSIAALLADDKSITRMAVGDDGWTVPWAVSADEEGLLWLDPLHSVDSRPGGTAIMRVKREPGGYRVCPPHGTVRKRAPRLRPAGSVQTPAGSPRMASAEHERTAPGPDIRPAARAGDADREHAVELLKSAFVAGRLSKDDFAARVGRALAADTIEKLDAEIADLPGRSSQPAGGRDAS